MKLPSFPYTPPISAVGNFVIINSSFNAMNDKLNKINFKKSFRVVVIKERNCLLISDAENIM